MGDLISNNVLDIRDRIALLAVSGNHYYTVILLDVIAFVLQIIMFLIYISTYIACSIQQNFNILLLDLWNSHLFLKELYMFMKSYTSYAILKVHSFNFDWFGKN